MDIENIVIKKIDLLIDEFKQYPDKFLTEADVRSYLYHLLLSDFNDIDRCEDGSFSNALHCEVRWYGNNGQSDLNLRSDIAIIDITTLRTQDFHLSKCFEFSRALAVIEIKLRRRKSKISDIKFQNAITRDRERFKQIKEAISNSFDSYLIIFDKKNNLNFEPVNELHHKEYYISLF